LPNRLIIPIVIFPTTEEMIKQEAKELYWEYQELIESYSRDYKAENYIDNPYCPHIINKHKINAFNINALASNPIKISFENVEHRPEREIAFLLLHEFGHWAMAKVHKYRDEKLADKFAIVWTKKLIDNGLIKND
jgi:DMSO/TMAO reductase YedYZ molybdopterin-dependent catalytic subunit